MRRVRVGSPSLAPIRQNRPMALRRSETALLVVVVITLVLYLVPYGATVAWPLVLFSTFVHELGHGLTALAVGGRFESLQVFPDASGVASYAMRPSRFGRAAVAAGGLLGPAIGAAVLYLLNVITILFVLRVEITIDQEHG